MRQLLFLTFVVVPILAVYVTYIRLRTGKWLQPDEWKQWKKWHKAPLVEQMVAEVQEQRKDHAQVPFHTTVAIVYNAHLDQIDDYTRDILEEEAIRAIGRLDYLTDEEKALLPYHGLLAIAKERLGSR